MSVRRLLLPLVSFVLVASPTFAQRTQWIGTVGDWDVADNWLQGSVPRDIDVVTVDNGGIVQINDDADALHLLVATAGSSLGTVQVLAGGLDVSVIAVGDGGIGSLQQLDGAVSATTLFVGLDPGGLGDGTYVLANGTLDIFRDATVQLGSLHHTDGSLVSHDLFTLEGRYVLTGGSAQFATLELSGELHVTGATPTISIVDLTMDGEGSLNVTIGTSGVSTIAVSAEAVLAGTLRVQSSFAETGTYEILTGDVVTGTFASVELPGSEWSWSIEDGVVSVTRSDETPVAEVSWSGLKAGYR